MEGSDMAGEVTLNGTVVAQDTASPLPAKPNSGLYLLTEDHQLLALVTDFMATQASTEYLRERSRPGFEAYLGKKVTVRGYLSGNTLWSATVID
jgi:hypothetical protein